MLQIIRVFILTRCADTSGYCQGSMCGDALKKQQSCISKDKAAVFAVWCKSAEQPDGFSFYLGSDKQELLQELNQNFVSITGKPLLVLNTQKIHELDF